MYNSNIDLWRPKIQDLAIYGATGRAADLISGPPEPLRDAVKYWTRLAHGISIQAITAASFQ